MVTDVSSNMPCEAGSNGFQLQKREYYNLCFVSMSWCKKLAKTLLIPKRKPERRDLLVGRVEQCKKEMQFVYLSMYLIKKRICEIEN